MYQRETIYLGMYINDERCDSAGFAKAESKDEKGRLNVTLRNVPPSVCGLFPVRVYDGEEWKELEKITIKDGAGNWSADGLPLKGGIRLQIMLSEHAYIYGNSKSARQSPMQTSMPEKAAMLDVKDAQERTVIPDKEIAQESAGISDQKKTIRRIDIPGKKEERKMTDMSDAQVEENTATDIRELKTADIPQPAAGPKPIEGLKEDKWEQILSIYPKIHPYGDERVYVKLEPKDFLILQEKYQPLTGNSFLLHGFYNYRYVILGKENGYYLGVPGVYYEREKMVALMFGFEAFECEGGNAESGKFGYYLRKVEL
jgi:hypothetical protein